MNKLIIPFLFIACLFMASCHHDDESELDETYPPKIEIQPFMTVENFPVIDGSDSTEPLRDILMCKALGFEYQWHRSLVDLVTKLPVLSHEMKKHMQMKKM